MCVGRRRGRASGGTYYYRNGGGGIEGIICSERIRKVGCGLKVAGCLGVCFFRG